MRVPRSHLHNCHLEPIFYRVNRNPNKLDQSLTVCSTIEDLTIVRTERIRGGFIPNQTSPNVCGVTSRLECWQKITSELWINLCNNFFCGSTRACTASISRCPDHTQTHFKVRTPLNDLSAGGKSHYLRNAQRTKETNFHAHNGILNCTPSNKVAEDSRLWTQDHRGQHEMYSWL